MQIINVDDGPIDDDRLAVFLDDHFFFQQGVAIDGISDSITEIIIRDFLGAVNAKVHLMSFAEAEIQTALPASPRGVPVQSSSSMVYHLSFNRSVDSIFRQAVKTSPFL